MRTSEEGSPTQLILLESQAGRAIQRAGWSHSYEVTEVQHLQGHCATIDLAAEYPEFERNVGERRNI